MTETAAARSETRVQVGRGNRVHRGNLDGNTYCGSQRRMGTRSGVSFLSSDTPVTCTKCGADTPAPVETPTVPTVDDRYCANHSYRVQREADGTCFLCD